MVDGASAMLCPRHHDQHRDPDKEPNRCKVSDPRQFLTQSYDEQTTLARETAGPAGSCVSGKLLRRSSVGSGPA
jgi:hypothetical protein